MKLEISNRRKTGKLPNMWKLNKTHLNTLLVKKQFTSAIKKYLEMNENKNLWDAVNVFRGKFIVLNAYIKKGKTPNHNPTLHLKELENEEQPKPKASRKEMIMIRAETHEIENGKTESMK